MSEENRLDVIVFGATGYTGNYAARQMVKFAKNRPQTTWGIAGRNKAKLEKVLEEVAEKTGESLKGVELVVADVSDAESIGAMARRAKVVVNCVGPYVFYGDVVVNACVEAGTHHVDVSGEPLFMETMVKKYDEKARENKSYIISACGFDSIPSDLGVVYAQKNFEGQINSIEAYLSSKSVGPKRPGPHINIGTWDSLVNGIKSRKDLKPLRKEIFPEPLPTMKPRLYPRMIIHQNPLIGDNWCLPFLGSDRPVVVRSQRHFYFHDKKRPIQFNVYFTVGSLISTIMFAIFASIIALIAQFSCGRQLLRKYPKFFSMGFFDRDAVPDEEGNKSKEFAFQLVAEGWKETLPEPTDQFSDPPNKRVIYKVSGVDPGYYSTTTALVLSALTLLDEADKIPDSGGVITPGVAFANTTLIEKLQENGIKFEILSQTDI